jgi:hypothetical protein
MWKLNHILLGYLLLSIVEASVRGKICEMTHTDFKVLPDYSVRKLLACIQIYKYTYWTTKLNSMALAHERTIPA